MLASVQNLPPAPATPAVSKNTLELEATIAQQAVQLAQQAARIAELETAAARGSLAAAPAAEAAVATTAAEAAAAPAAEAAAATTAAEAAAATTAAAAAAETAVAASAAPPAPPTNPHETWGVLGEQHARRADTAHLRTALLFGFGLGEALKSSGHPDKGLTRAAAATLDDLLAMLLQRIMRAAAREAKAQRADYFPQEEEPASGGSGGSGLSDDGNSFKVRWEEAHGRLLSPRDVQVAVRLVFRGELATHGVSEAAKAVSKGAAQAAAAKKKGAAMGSGWSGGRGQQPSKDPLSAAAGLALSVVVVGELMARLSGAAVSDAAAMCMVGALEYLATELLELSANEATRDKWNCQLIGHRDLVRAVGRDKELDALFPGFGGSSVPPTPWRLGGASAVAAAAAAAASDPGAEAALREALVVAVAADEAAGCCHYTAGKGVLRIADGGGGDASCFGSGGSDDEAAAEDLAEVLGKPYHPAFCEVDYYYGGHQPPSSAAVAAGTSDPRGNSVREIGDGMVRRLAVRAGVPAVHPLAYEATRGVIERKLEDLVRAAAVQTDARSADLVSAADVAFGIDACAALCDDASLAGSGTAVALLRARAFAAAQRIAAGAARGDGSEAPNRDWSAAVAAFAGGDSGDDDDSEYCSDGVYSDDEQEEEEEEEGESEAGNARTAAHRAHVRDFCARAPRACEQRALPFLLLSRLVRAIGAEVKADLGWDARAIAMLGAAVESHAVRAFQRAVAASSAGDAAGIAPAAPLSAPQINHAARELSRRS
jgi:hypothetical protein